MDIISLYDIFKQYPLISTDTRNIKPNSLFFALKGENFNGNKFAEEALLKGAAYVIVDEKEALRNASDKNKYILVSDSLKVLQALARYHREQLKIPIIAITGTNGKTTTKELAHIVLSKQYNVLSTFGNLNNHIGVPLTLLRINKNHELAIVEMGANHKGEIASLCEIAKPNYGLITNIGVAHMEGFGSIENLIDTKKELYDYIKDQDKDGRIFLNANSSILSEIAKKMELTTIEYGTGKIDDNFITGKILDAQPNLKLEWCIGSLCYITDTQLVGRYNLNNILAAISIAKYFGVSSKNISEALSEYEVNNNRSQFKQTEHNKLIIDAYNANPSSMSAALENFDELTSNNKVLILGDMQELGEQSETSHIDIVKLLEQYKFNQVYLVGKNFKKAAEGTNFVCFDNEKELRESIKKNPIKDKYILIKGSRSLQLEKIVDLL